MANELLNGHFKTIETSSLVDKVEANLVGLLQQQKLKVGDSIPKEIEEAAWIDGCSRFSTLTRIVLPLSLPGLATAFIFTFIAAWNEFVIALTLTSSPEQEPLTVGLTALIGFYQVQWQYLFAGSLIAIVPVVILFASIEKWLVGGLTAGSVK